MDVKVEPQTMADEPSEQLEDLPSLPKPRNNTVIAKGVTLSGALLGEGAAQIEGDVEGEIDLNGSVIVSATGNIKGPVSADVIRVAGRIVGNVIARDHLRLEKTGMIEGDVTTGSMVVEDGGLLNGRSTMVKVEKSTVPPANNLPLDELQFGSNYKAGEEETAEES